MSPEGNVLTTVSVVVPVYNAEQALPELVARLRSALGGLARPYELVLINDGSVDGSWPAVRALAASHPEVHGLDLMRNYGQQSALLAGIRAARGDVIVTMDDDLQNPPEEVPRLLAKLAEGYDVVYGVPEHRQHGRGRNLAGRLLRLALRTATPVAVARNLSSFRAFRAPLLEALADGAGPPVSLDVMLTWGTSRFAAVPVRHEPPRGPSGYSWPRLLARAVNLLTGFATWPLHLASVMGVAAALVGLLLLVYLMPASAPEVGFRRVVLLGLALTALSSGVQMVMLGILGQYVAQVHLRVMNRPPSLVRDSVGFGPRAGTAGS